jgi:hypothetical protein
LLEREGGEFTDRTHNTQKFVITEPCDWSIIDWIGLRSRMSNIGSTSLGRTNDTSKGFPSLETTIDEFTSACLSPPTMVCMDIIHSRFSLFVDTHLLFVSPLLGPVNIRIITSNRAHIVKLHETKHIKSMKTQHQYLLVHHHLPPHRLPVSPQISF